MKMQDARLGLKGTMATELPVISAFRTRASKGISREGTLFFGRPEIPGDLLRINNVFGARVIFVSRGADLGVNR